MPEIGERYCMFDTAFGLTGIAWSADGLTRVHLPEADAAMLRAWMERHGTRRGDCVPGSGSLRGVAVLC